MGEEPKSGDDEDLYRAVSSGYLDKVQEVVEKTTVDLTTASKNGVPIVNVACQYGHADIVDYLLEKGAPLPRAIAIYSKYEVLKVVLLRARADQVVAAWNYVSRSGGLASMEYLIDNYREHVNLNQALLSNLSSRCDEKKIELLIQRGADVNATDSPSGRTPLQIHLSTFNSQASIVKILLDNGSTVHDTALHEAAKSRNFGAVDLLVNRGANINAVNDKGETPLHMADTQTMAMFLVQAGADLWKVSKSGQVAGFGMIQVMDDENSSGLFQSLLMIQMNKKLDRLDG